MLIYLASSIVPISEMGTRRRKAGLSNAEFGEPIEYRQECPLGNSG